MLIYVTGRGLSGSTILDIALSQSDNVAGMGEFIVGLKKNEKCSCGIKLIECGKWKELFSEKSELEEEDFIYLERESRVTNYPKYFFSTNNVFKNISENYLTINSKIIEIKKRSCNADIIVDSSKEVTRGLILSRGCKDCIIIHLVRDPLKVISSTMYHFEKGWPFRFMRKKFYNKNAKYLFMIISSFSWLLGNLLIEIAGLYSKGKKVKIRYEDLCAYPDGEIEKVEKKINVDLSSSKAFLKGEKIANNVHTVRGNPTRYQNDLLFDKNRAVGKHGLNFFQKTLARVIVAPLRIAYGYGL